MVKTLLLVDDEPEILKCLGDTLNRFGYKVIARPDGQSALSVIRDGTRVDLVITDYRMPGMDGLEFILAAKRILPSAPVIMLTAYGDVETYLKAFNLGVFEYINKPVGAKELGRIVQAALDNSESGKTV